MGLPNLGVYLYLVIPTTKREGFLVFRTVKYKQMNGLLLHHYWQGFFALVICLHLQRGKNATTKNGSPKLVIYLCLVLHTTNGKDFLYFARKCKQVYSVLPHNYWQGYFALDCAWSPPMR